MNKKVKILKHDVLLINSNKTERKLVKRKLNLFISYMFAIY